MAPFSSSPPLFFLFLYFGASLTSINGEPIPSLPTLTPLSFHDTYTQLFGDSNLALRRGGKRVHIALDRRTGAGFASRRLYLHGFFRAAIKLPSDYAAGVVVAFYMSNGDVFEKTHDELDFEFLGNIRGREWRVQTNVYGNGSTSTGREERYSLWFDPTEDFHQYAILWSSSRIIFYIDGIAIREVVRTQAMDGLGQFPSKPMSLYATIWDGSSWATSGGRYKVNYEYAPYVAEFTDLVLRGCTADLTTHQPTCRQADIDMYDTVDLSVEQRLAMDDFREKHMTYGYCYDHLRYVNPPQSAQQAVRPAFSWSRGKPGGSPTAAVTAMQSVITGRRWMTHFDLSFI